MIMARKVKMRWAKCGILEHTASNKKNQQS
jgi:hypothetical protein